MNKQNLLKLRFLALFLNASAAIASYPINPPPNYRWKTCVSVICPTRVFNRTPGLPSPNPPPPISDKNAVELALFAGRQLVHLRKKEKAKPEWQQYRIFVFNDQKAADEFQKFLDLPKRVEPLTSTDYPKLTETWKLALVCVAFKSGTSNGRIYYPARYPTDWWKPLLAQQNPASNIRNDNSRH